MRGGHACHSLYAASLRTNYKRRGQVRCLFVEFNADEISGAAVGTQSGKSLFGYLDAQFSFGVTTKGCAFYLQETIRTRVMLIYNFSIEVNGRPLAPNLFYPEQKASLREQYPSQRLGKIAMHVRVAGLFDF